MQRVVRTRAIPIPYAMLSLYWADSVTESLTQDDLSTMTMTIYPTSKTEKAN